MTSYGARLALLGGIIDYAGTFPPAALPLEGALKRAASFRNEGRHPWLMGKVALPLADIKKLTPKTLFEAGADGSAWIYTALGTPVEHADDVERTVEFELREVRRLNERRFDNSCRQWIAAYETRLGADALSVPVNRLLGRVRDRVGHTVVPFFELGWAGAWRERLSGFAETLAAGAAETGLTGSVPGLKFRTGGKETPTTEQLAAAVAIAARHGLKFKATQGLHRPVTGKDGFGFVNLFAALALAYALGEEKFGEAEAALVLDDKERSNFVFSSDKLRWRKLELTCEAIEEARRVHAGTFGSCSLDEPDEFLAGDFPEEA